MVTFISIIIALVLWLLINAFAYNFTEVWIIPYKVKFINFKPFNCNKCCTFWMNVFANVVLGLSTSFQYLTAEIIWLVATILTAIAMHIDEKQHYIDMSEIDKIIEQNKNKDE